MRALHAELVSTAHLEGLLRQLHEPFEGVVRGEQEGQHAVHVGQRLLSGENEVFRPAWFDACAFDPFIWIIIVITSFSFLYKEKNSFKLQTFSFIIVSH